MKVKHIYTKAWHPRLELTEGRVYDILFEESNTYLIKDDTGQEQYFYKERFESVGRLKLSKFK